STVSPRALAATTSPATRAAYLPWWVSGARPVTSPAAYSHCPSTSEARPVSSTRTGSPGSRPTVSRPSVSVAGLRPVATSSRSTSSAPSGSPTLTESSTSDTDSAPVSGCNRTPAASSPSATASPTKSGYPGSGRGPVRIRCTSEPSRAHACAISVPTAPPPRTASLPGPSDDVVASREVHTSRPGSPSSPGNDGVFGTLPVHTITA